MRNVVKGFEFSQMAVPKVHEGKINSSFNSFHGPSVRGPTKTYLRSAPKSPLRKAPGMPGKNVGMLRGGKV
jgi:hypothetical protein